MTLNCAVISTGICSCAGSGVENAWNLALSNKCDSFEKLSIFDSPRYSEKLVGVSGVEKKSKNSRCAEFLFRALDEALSKIDDSALPKEKTAVYFGTSIGGIFETENMLMRGDGNFAPLAQYECSTLAYAIAKKIGAGGECSTYSTACSSSSLAIAAACNAISQGDCEVAFVCGADALSRITVNGFGSLLLLSNGKSAPFDKNRDGINLGECGAVAILASENFAKKIGAKILGYVSGWGCSADAYHATAPSPDGDGMARAILEALKKADISSDEISYYNAHGTGTRGNDSSEAVAIKKVFSKGIYFSSLKGKFGHTLGASGLLNFIISLEALNKNIIPPNSGFENFDEEIGLEPTREAFPKDINHIASCSFGFGGNNACVVISKSSKKRTEKKSEIVAGLGRSEKRRVFIYKSGVASSLGVGLENFLNVGERVEKQGVCEESELLKNISPLKKRKWAKLQKMGLQASIEALENLTLLEDGMRVAVCMGTGLGMAEETRKFVENLIKKREAEPMPTAFTNSVHNAASSLISVHFGFKALNSAVSAKEISFESALKQALGEINSEACSAALVGSADEYSEYAEKFRKNFARFSTRKNSMTEIAAVHFLGLEGVCKESPVCEILGVDIARKHVNPREEARRIGEFLLSLNLKFEDVSAWLVPSVFNSWTQNYLESIKAFCGVKSFEVLEEKFGANYSLSACVPFLVSDKNKIVCAYSLSSGGTRAISAFKKL